MVTKMPSKKPGNSGSFHARRRKNHRNTNCWIVIELVKGKEPKILGVFKTKSAAEAVAYADAKAWRNVIEQPLRDA